MFRISLLCLATGGVLFLTGCGSRLPSVTGTVTMDGQPLDGAVILFSPEGQGGQVATGVADSSGKFQMGTYKPGDGVMPGKYKVTVTRSEEPMKPTPSMGEVMAQKYRGKSQDEAKGASKDAMKTKVEQRAEYKKKRKPTPLVYQDLHKTPLTADVPAQRDYKFELQSDAK
jgi:hypothetical protein